MTDQTQTPTTNNGPIQTLRDGAITVKLWRQESRNGPFVTATLGRTYQDKQTQEFKESRSLSGSDVLKAQALLGEANREMIAWRKYFKAEQEKLAQEQAEARANQPKSAATDMTAARDAALANARGAQERPAAPHVAPQPQP